MAVPTTMPIPALEVETMTFPHRTAIGHIATRALRAGGFVHWTGADAQRDSPFQEVTS